MFQRLLALALVRQCFIDLLNGKSFILPEHEKQFAALHKSISQKPQIKNSTFGDYMEARLFADLAYYKLQNKAWEIPETVQNGKQIVCGIVAEPEKNRRIYNDMVSRAAKGWKKNI